MIAHNYVPQLHLLIQLAQHLLTGVLGHRVFTLSYYNLSINEKYVEGACGTHGCAIGECPIIWPEQWIFNDFHGHPALKEFSHENSYESGKAFFGLSDEQFDSLFVVGNRKRYIEVEYDENTPKEDVARNILAFVKEQQHVRAARAFINAHSFPEIAIAASMNMNDTAKALCELHRQGEIDMVPWIEKNISSKSLFKGVEYFRRVQAPTYKEARETLGLDDLTLMFCELYIWDADKMKNIEKSFDDL